MSSSTEMTPSLDGLPVFVKQKILLELTGVAAGTLDNFDPSRVRKPNFGDGAALASTCKAWDDAWCTFKMTHMARYLGALAAGQELFAEFFSNGHLPAIMRYSKHALAPGSTHYLDLVAEILAKTTADNKLLADLVARCSDYSDPLDQRMYCVQLFKAVIAPTVTHDQRLQLNAGLQQWAELRHHEQRAAPDTFVSTVQHDHLPMSVSTGTQLRRWGSSLRKKFFSERVRRLNLVQTEFVKAVDVGNADFHHRGPHQTPYDEYHFALALLRHFQDRDVFDWSDNAKLLRLPHELFTDHNMQMRRPDDSLMFSELRANQGPQFQHRIAASVLFARLGAWCRVAIDRNTPLRYRLRADRGTLMNLRYNEQITRNVVDKLRYNSHLFYVQYGMCIGDGDNGPLFGDELLHFDWFWHAKAFGGDDIVSGALYDARSGVGKPLHYLRDWPLAHSTLGMLHVTPRRAAPVSTRQQPLDFCLNTRYPQHDTALQGLWQFIDSVSQSCSSVWEPQIWFDLADYDLPIDGFGIDVTTREMLGQSIDESEVWMPKMLDDDEPEETRMLMAGANHSSTFHAYERSRRPPISTNSPSWRREARDRAVASVRRLPNHMCILAYNTIGPTADDREFVLLWNNRYAHKPVLLDALETLEYSINGGDNGCARWYENFWRRGGCEAVPANFTQMMFCSYRVNMEALFEQLNSRCASVADAVRFFSNTARIKAKCKRCYAVLANALAVTDRCPQCAQRKRELTNSDSGKRRRVRRKLSVSAGGRSSK